VLITGSRARPAERELLALGLHDCGRRLGYEPLVGQLRLGPLELGLQPAALLCLALLSDCGIEPVAGEELNRPALDRDGSHGLSGDTVQRQSGQTGQRMAGLLVPVGGDPGAHLGARLDPGAVAPGPHGLDGRDQP
jgi:hypothetical protein